ncbi:glutamate carboxypeptidase [Streptoalloteichus tenebrarius]|uniref:Glutamate carboxypeptidase n=1 Tax=Streptoalloteichus tenebrarius (strain ATCC 17920 / DSM 40477 / JCM 4838 / CBS 697.72 / NBRC 16177 / NCIMB 11028 / NRRL B-12390 / A12253. 1 / ISP 5477) TaxID=1933 RepID=A0ABT1HP59_STRSD|nr:M20/M25/M40 family metallo-hydrolase [Streptoalloteichus tenebrarius]MCP2257278.1 glutamate carboxypeptidase [Streptoalloteichus tenebrarius]BFF04186.1 M20 family metallopeptidase [Streptoalloteichus tenebrarius]
MTSATPTDQPLGWLTARIDDLVADLALLVDSESPSTDKDHLDRTADLLHDWLPTRLPDVALRRLRPDDDGAGIVEAVVRGDAGDAGEVLVVGHYDTVWPAGTLADWPFTVVDGVASGPGAFDMKAGIVQAVWAVAALRRLGLPHPAVRFLFTPDEEIGSTRSRPVIERAAEAAVATLVPEPGVDGRVKTRRKGIGLFRVETLGVEVHAGLEPEKGASAVTALAEALLALRSIADPGAGTTLNPGVVAGGTRTNVVAGRAHADVDVRVSTEAEMRRVERELARMEVSDPRVELRVTGEWNRPPMTPNLGSRGLLDIARGVARELGGVLDEVSVGGASDGNFVSALGRPVLDGVGAVGGGAHARTEHVLVDRMPYQAALVAGVVARLATTTPQEAATASDH